MSFIAQHTLYAHKILDAFDCTFVLQVAGLKIKTIVFNSKSSIGQHEGS